MNYKQVDPKYKAFVFELDDVLFPGRDYLLQVYYLFASFLEYTETFPPAADLTDFMKKAYESHGETQLFDKAMEVFGFDAKYRENFERLHAKARLPLKLLLFDNARTFLEEAVADGKQIIVITGGNPEMQYNKLGQIDWGVLAKHVRVYFAEEYGPKPSAVVLQHVQNELKLTPDELLVLGNSDLDREFAANGGVDFSGAGFAGE